MSNSSAPPPAARGPAALSEHPDPLPLQPLADFDAVVCIVLANGSAVMSTADKRALRQTSGAARAAVDRRIQSISLESPALPEFPTHWSVLPQLTTVRYASHYSSDLTHLDAFLSLPMPRLKELFLARVTPPLLAHLVDKRERWPALTHLCLIDTERYLGPSWDEQFSAEEEAAMVEKDRAEAIDAFQRIKRANWALQRLSISESGTVHSFFTTALAVAAFSSIRELEVGNFPEWQGEGVYGAKLDTVLRLNKVELPQLEHATIYGGHLRSRRDPVSAVSKPFDSIPVAIALAPWPKLRHLVLCDVLFSNFNWHISTNPLKSFGSLLTLKVSVISATELPANLVLKGLDGGAIEELTLQRGQSLHLDAFSLVELPFLRRLEIIDWDPIGESLETLSAGMNALFTADLPSLQYLTVSFMRPWVVSWDVGVRDGGGAARWGSLQAAGDGIFPAVVLPSLKALELSRAFLGDRSMQFLMRNVAPHASIVLLGCVVPPFALKIAKDAAHGMSQGSRVVWPKQAEHAQRYVLMS